MPIEPRFIVDTMLGDLARWLRILGYDTLYSNKYEDWKILKTSENDKRIIVTRDRGLFIKARKKSLDVVLIEGEEIYEMLRELKTLLGIRLEIDPDDTRCPICNTPLRRTTSLNDVIGRVSDNILKKYKEFWICDKCGKVYWRGRHWRSIEKILEKAKVGR
ncbi:MAG: hypothetical protein GU359_01945 [Desulfurococcales archaeon]|jgi:hypothetical protein|nr:hypothetical protein [Desulfurococcales archaeon]